MANVTVRPSCVIVADTADEYDALIAWLDGHGYSVASENLLSRTDTPGSRTVSVEYPTWTLSV